MQGGECIVEHYDSVVVIWYSVTRHVLKSQYIDSPKRPIPISFILTARLIMILVYRLYMLLSRFAFSSACSNHNTTHTFARHNSPFTTTTAFSRSLSIIPFISSSISFLPFPSTTTSESSPPPIFHLPPNNAADALRNGNWLLGGGGDA